MENGQETNLNDVLTEKELMEMFGLKKTIIDKLRREDGFPFCKLSKYDRLYLVDDILDFIKSKRVVLKTNNPDLERTQAMPIFPID